MPDTPENPDPKIALLRAGGFDDAADLLVQIDAVKLQAEAQAAAPEQQPAKSPLEAEAEVFAAGIADLNRNTISVPLLDNKGQN